MGFTKNSLGSQTSLQGFYDVTRKKSLRKTHTHTYRVKQCPNFIEKNRFYSEKDDNFLIKLIIYKK